MDWITIVITAVTGLVSALGGGGLVYWRQDKKAKEIQNEQSALTIWKELLERSDADSREKAAKIDAMGTKIEELRKENNRLELENQALRWHKCVVNGCKNRRPPRDRDLDTVADNENE